MLLGKNADAEEECNSQAQTAVGDEESGEADAEEGRHVPHPQLESSVVAAVGHECEGCMSVVAAGESARSHCEGWMMRAQRAR